MIPSKLKRRRGGNTAQHSAIERGFTLVETSIALFILMVAGLGLASLFTYSIQNNSGGNDRAVAMSIAQQQIEQFRSVPFSYPILPVSAATMLPPDPLTKDHRYPVTQTITRST